MAIHTGELRIESNDPASPALRSLRGEALSFIGAFSYSSVEGTGQMVGITEFSDVSSPARKYRELLPSQAGWQRTKPGYFERVFSSNFTRYNTAGAKTQQLAYGQQRTGASGGAVIDTLEAYIASDADFRTPFVPQWTKTKLEKYTDSININSGAGENTPSFIKAKSSVAVASNTTADIFLFSEPSFQTDHWEVSVTVAIVVSGGSGSGAASLYYTLANGDQEPPDPTTEGIFVGTIGASAGGGNDQTFTVNVPLGASVRFSVRATHSFGTSQWNPFPLELSATGMQEVGLKTYYFLPETDTLESPRYSEHLAIEDTPFAAIDRNSPTTGTEEVASTVSFTGGTSAESHTPIDVEGIGVKRAQTFINLTSGRRYQWTVTYETSDDDFATSTTHQETGQFDAVAATHDVEFFFFAPPTFKRRISSVALQDVGATPIDPTAYNQNALQWYASALDAGGAPTEEMLQIVSDLADAIDAWSGAADLQYVLPLVGDDVATAFTPLYDRGGFGRPTNNNFVDADVSVAGGLQGDGGTTRVQLPILASQLGSSNNGGLGYWELDFVGAAGTQPLGSYNTAGTNRFVLDLRPTLRAFRWGAPGNGASQATSADNAHYYGQRSSATSRVLYRGGVSVASDTTSDGASGANEENINLMAVDEGSGFQYWDGRCGIAYLTNGTLTPTEISDLHDLLTTFMEACGRL